MRPLNIKLSAFGPYAEEIEIPMEELGSQGLYLITGDTGAGKTTIFDAICFALFGDASGPNRDASMFRSKYARPETPTEVELRFLHGGKEYVVKRNPDYERPKARGEGMTHQAADALLTMPDGTVVTKVRDVNAAVENILGINREQFSQIAMLAQGDFLKLLLADTKQRQEIFRELFHTKYYQILQLRLEDQRKEVYGQVEDAKKSLKQYVGDIQVDQDDVLSIQVDQAKSNGLTTEDILALLDQLIEQDTKKKEQIDAQQKRLDSELEQVNKRLGAAEQINKAKEDAKVAREQLMEEEPKLEKCMSMLEAAKGNLERKDILLKNASDIEHELPNYDTAETLRKEIASLETQAVESEKCLASDSEMLEEKQEELTKLKAESRQLQDTSAEIEKRKAQIERIDQEIKSLLEYTKAIKAYGTEFEKLEKAQARYRAADDEFRKANGIYEAMEQRFRDGQAGILAEKLKEGEKCPVCGSTHHPSLAHLEEDVPTEQALKLAKQESDAAREVRENAANDSGVLNGKVESLESDLKKKSESLFGLSDLKMAQEACATKQERCAAEREEARVALEEESAKKMRKDQIEEQIPKCEEEVQTLQSRISETRSQLSALCTKQKDQNLRMKEVQSALKFESKAQALDKLNALQEEATDIQRRYDEATAEADRQSKKITELKAAIAENEKKIQSEEAIDLEAEKEKQAQLNKERETCISGGRIVVTRLENNIACGKHIAEVAEGIVEIEKKLQWVKALSDTANGNLTGKDKVMLETYIQTTYFDRIIHRANLRLMIMSGGQYELKRMQEAEDGRSKSGLDLGVIDHYNGSERSVKSLSGGESFMASLSLALGLSDEVQSQAGGIQIDTMFVDEGFGSLDPEALEMAYKALAGLTEGNRLVGIISHVADLKERIDKQIVVTKAKSGGSHIQVVV